ncbi:hypothetical protein LTS17_001446 [Exophiala oligosperma]
MDSTSTTVALVISSAVAIVVGLLVIGFHLRKCYRERHQRQVIHGQTDLEGGLHQRILEAELETERGWSRRSAAQRRRQGQGQGQPAAPTTTITEPPPVYTPGALQRENDDEAEPSHVGVAAESSLSSSSSLRRSSRYRLAIRSSTMTTFDVDFDAEILEENEEEEVTVSNAHLPPPYSRHDPRVGRLPSYGSVDAAGAVTPETSVRQGRTARGQQRRQRRTGGGPGSFVAGDRSAFYSRRQTNLRAMLDDIERGYPHVREALFAAGDDERRWSWSSSSSSSSSSG